MRSLVFSLLFLISGALAQYPGGSPPWGQAGPRPSYGKPSRPSPFSRPVPNYGKPVPPHPPGGLNSDDPIPANPGLDSSHETQQLPSKLPLLAPNGVVEIYNRVVDDLIKKLEVSFKKKEIDPMRVVIRPTPATPVRVPGHLQKRPFRRPGAPLYRSNLQPMGPLRMRTARSVQPEEPTPLLPAAPLNQGLAEEKPSFRGVGKISKGPLGEEKLDGGPSVSTPETSGGVPAEPLAPEGESPPSPSPLPPILPAQVNIHLVDAKSVESSEEEPNLFRASISEEYEEEVEEIGDKEPSKSTKSRTTIQADKKTKKDKERKKEEEEDEDEDLKGIEEGKKDVDKLIQRYQNKNVNGNNEETSKGKNKYSTGGGKKKEDGGSKKKPEVEKEKEKGEAEEEVVEEDEDDEDNQDDLEEGTNGPNGNPYYPHGPSQQQKPNAELTGLSKMKRASDVTVNVDARSALITARLLVGPLHVNINDSIEPMERNVRATIPELEAELILMERHGVVFLQRFTLDRAYGQDVEISMPKAKADGKKKKIGVLSGVGGGPGQGPTDPNHPQTQQRFQTKMAAHISMEVVKLLRSGNLRVNIMRTAQSSMSKLKLPIKTNRRTKNKKTLKKSDKKEDKD